LPGVEAFPSAANFILFRTTRPGDDLFETLLQQGVLVRNVGSVPGLQDCLRVTVGTKAENGRFLEALTKALRWGTGAEREVE
ncbi:MAG: aminotransferase class I/II-fold pyridoxal phosphate-dependent enzyme, partial [candidate division NC10 bacterium]|nr:aminotransferase class I/II-fold pyridoxal phosphate-dependent enzyme [candidate division NC10 bacterium]